MKRFMLGMAAVVALALVPGCGKKAETKVEPVKAQGTLKKQADAPKEAQTGAAQAVEKTAAVPAVPAAEKAPAVPAAEKAPAPVAAVAAKVEAAVPAATSAFDKLVAEAKTLIADKKYADALTKLQAGLAQPALDATQKSTLQKLIDQVKAALTTGAAKDAKDKASNLLKGVGGK